VPASSVNYRFKSGRVARKPAMIVTGLVTRNHSQDFVHQECIRGPNRGVLVSTG